MESKPKPEIERKWRLPQMPPLEVYIDYKTVPCIMIWQHYLIIEEEYEDRIRRAAKQYSRTIKRGKGVCRDEQEVAISANEFERLLPTTIASLTKNRYRIRYGDWTLELDQYTGLLTGRVILEVEFKTEEDANAFTLPDWAQDAIEVTTDERFKNKNLALYGFPSTHLCTIQ